LNAKPLSRAWAWAGWLLRHLPRIEGHGMNAAPSARLPVRQTGSRDGVDAAEALTEAERTRRRPILMSAPATMLALAPHFSKLVWQLAQVLLIGALSAPGRRTVTSARTLGGGALTWLSIPAPDLLVQAQDAVQQRLRAGRAAGDVHVHRDDLIYPLHHGIGVDHPALATAMAAYLAVAGMGCPRSATRVRNGLLSLDGILATRVFLEDGIAVAAYDPQCVGTDHLLAAVAAAQNKEVIP